MKKIFNPFFAGAILVFLVCSIAFGSEQCPEIPANDKGLIDLFMTAYPMLLEGDPDIWEGYNWANLSIILIFTDSRRAYQFNSDDLIEGFAIPCGYENSQVSLRMSETLFGELSWDGHGFIHDYATPNGGEAFIQFITANDLAMLEKKGKAYNQYVPGKDPAKLENKAEASGSTQFEMHPLGLAIHENFHNYQNISFNDNSDKSLPGVSYYPVQQSDFDLFPYLYAQLQAMKPFLKPEHEIIEKAIDDERGPLSFFWDYFEEGRFQKYDEDIKAAFSKILSVRMLMNDGLPDKYKAFERKERHESSAAYVENRWLEKIGIVKPNLFIVKAILVVLSETDDFAPFQQVSIYYLPTIYYSWLDDLLPDWNERLANGDTISKLMRAAISEEPQKMSEEEFDELIQNEAFEKALEEGRDYKSSIDWLSGFFEDESVNRLEICRHEGFDAKGGFAGRSIFGTMDGRAFHVGSDFYIKGRGFTFETSNAFLLEYDAQNGSDCKRFAGFENFQFEGVDLDALFASGEKKHVRGSLSLQQNLLKEKLQAKPPPGEPPAADSHSSITFDAMAKYYQKAPGFYVLELWPVD